MPSSTSFPFRSDRPEWSEKLEAALAQRAGQTSSTTNAAYVQWLYLQRVPGHQRIRMGRNRD